MVPKDDEIRTSPEASASPSIAQTGEDTALPTMKWKSLLSRERFAFTRSEIYH